jgi:hypothetical protein
LLTRRLTLQKKTEDRNLLCRADEGVGRIYQQTFIDTFAKLYQSSIDASVVQKPNWMMNPGQLRDCLLDVRESENAAARHP